MADTGYNWDNAWTVVPEEDTTAWTDITQADTSGAQSDPISNDLKAATEISIKMVEDNTGAIDGPITIYILGDTDGTIYEDITNSAPFSFEFTPTQNATVVIRFRILGSDYSDFRIHLQNESGQELVTTMKFRQATIPVASA